ncbi:MAG: site-specific integrase [bacterium]
MPTVRFFLQKPYKERKQRHKLSDTIKSEISLNVTKNGNSKKRPLNQLETRLYACLIIDREQIIKIKTEYVIYPAQWNFDSGQLKENIAGSPEFNEKLLKLKKKLLAEYDRIISEDYPPDTEIPFTEVKAKLVEFGKNIEKPTVKQVTNFFEVLCEYIDYLEGVVAEGTIKKYVTLQKSLKKFTEENDQYKTLTFSGIDHKFYDAYTKYLRNQAPRGRQKTRPEGMQKGLLIDTIGKYIECLKTFLTWAEDRKYNKFTIYKNFHNINKADRKRKKRSLDIVTLTLSELKTFYEYDFSDDPSFDRVRDLFCFEAFSGQRWSDLQQFDRSQLHGDIWRFTADKTKKEIEIDMTGFAAPALDILKKYDYKLPQISNQKFNEYMKDAAEKAGIDAQTTIRRFVGSEEIKMTKPKHRFLSSHSARRSAVSILLNDYNMNPVHVMEITGHSDLKTLQKYIKPDRQARRQAMSKTTPITGIMKVAHKAI